MKQELQKRVKQYKDTFDNLNEEKQKLELRLREVNTEILRVQGAYREFNKLIKEYGQKEKGEEKEVRKESK